MKKIILAMLAGLALILSPTIARAQDADAIIGVWHTTPGTDSGDIRIFKRNNQYFGQVMSLAEPNWPANDKMGMGGKPKTDRHNPNPKLRDQPILGMELMSDFVYVGKNVWEEGKVYDPLSGKTYKCKMILKSGNRLEVRGYIGFSLFGRTVTWTR